jgi:transposase
LTDRSDDGIGGRVNDGASVEPRLLALEAQVASLAQERNKIVEERDEYRKLVLHLREENERLKRGLLGQKAERLPRNDTQLSLLMLGLALGGDDGASPAAVPPEQTVAEHTRAKPVRKPLPPELPREEIVIVPPEVERDPGAYELIGSETREVVERRPSASIVVALIYNKYVPKDRKRGEPTQVIAAEAVEMPIERGVAGPGMLADTIVRRWQDHQPLNRLEGIYARDGLVVAKSTMCTWHEKLAELARPLVAAMRTDALMQPYLCVDATGVLVLAKERCRVGHFWVTVAPDKHVLFNYSKRHDGAAVDALLPGYAGYLVADAHAVYDHLYRGGAVVEVACWAHTRRYFFKALESDPGRAKTALAWIGALFALERSLISTPAKKRREVRQARAAPIIDAFFEWCHREREHVLDQSPIAQGIGYACNQQDALRRFLDDGRLPVHNNISEMNLRREVIGRKNWLFVGSDEGAEVNAVFVSLLASASMHRLEPFTYMRDLLCLLPNWPRHRVLELAPAYWRQTLENSETQQALEAHVLRRVVLGLPGGPAHRPQSLKQPSAAVSDG